MQTNGDIITQVLVRNNRTTTDSFITDTMLSTWLNDAYVWAASYYKWPFTEQIDSIGTFSGEQYAYNDVFGTLGPKIDSIRMLGVGSLTDMSQIKLYQKTDFASYVKYRSEYPEGTDRIFADFNRAIYVNPNTGDSGSIYTFFQVRPAALDRTDLTAETVFSLYDDEGNEAICEKMSSYLKRREHLAEEAELHDKRAVEKLTEVWKRIQDEQAMYQASPTSEGMWKRIDVLEGGFSEDNFRRDQF